MEIAEAKRELKVIKEIQADIDSVNNEIERLYTTITKMTTATDCQRIKSASDSRVEETLEKIDKYRSRLVPLVNEMVEYKDRCMRTIEKVQPNTLRTILIYYYFQNNTLEKTAEMLGHSYQWTYALFTSALEKYCAVHDRNR